MGAMPSRWLFGLSTSGFVVALATLGTSLPGCGGGSGDQTPLVDNDPGSGGGGGGGTGNGAGGGGGSSGGGLAGSADGGDAGPSGACASGSTAAGCPCATPGLTVACGQVHRVSGDYVSCSPGTQTCDVDFTWGACLGDRVGAP